MEAKLGEPVQADGIAGLDVVVEVGDGIEEDAES